jgi:DNA polymerase III subunit epsilon
MTEKQRLINELLEHNFECEAGPLANSITFKDLKRIIDEEADQENKIIVGGIMPELERPICFIDIETTGVDVDHSFIVELSVHKVNPDGSHDTRTMLINPGVPIPKEATDVHGITDEDVKDKPTFAAISKSLLKHIDGCDICGFNSNRFDIPLLAAQFERVGLSWDWRKVNLIDVRNIFVQKEERTLSAGVKFYLGRDHEEAHSAEGDILETKNIFLAQLARYEELGKMTMKEVALFSNYNKPIIDLAGKFEYNEAGEIVFTFGQHKGKVAKNEKGFLNWMLTKDFTKDTKEAAKRILLS